MELVIGLTSNKLAHIVTDQGWHEVVPVAHLKTRGTPSGTRRETSIYTNFANWRLLDVDEANTYPQAFGIQANLADHQVFEFSSGGHIYHVLALVVIRALLRNKPSLINAVFRPQGLELTVTPIFENNRLSMCALPDIHHRVVGPDFLLWLYAYPSARRMFHSIFLLSMRGQLGLTLPDCTIEIQPRFMRLHRPKGIRYVTQLGIVNLRTGERPLEFYETQTSVSCFNR